MKGMFNKALSLALLMSVAGTYAGGDVTAVATVASKQGKIASLWQSVQTNPKIVGAANSTKNFFSTTVPGFATSAKSAVVKHPYIAAGAVAGSTLAYEGIKRGYNWYKGQDNGVNTPSRGIYNLGAKTINGTVNGTKYVCGKTVDATMFVAGKIKSGAKATKDAAVSAGSWVKNHKVKTAAIVGVSAAALGGGYYFRKAIGTGINAGYNFVKPYAVRGYNCCASKVAYGYNTYAAPYVVTPIVKFVKTHPTESSAVAAYVAGSVSTLGFQKGKSLFSKAPVVAPVAPVAPVVAPVAPVVAPVAPVASVVAPVAPVALRAVSEEVVTDSAATLRIQNALNSIVFNGKGFVNTELKISEAVVSDCQNLLTAQELTNLSSLIKLFNKQNELFTRKAKSANGRAIVTLLEKALAC